MDKQTTIQIVQALFLFAMMAGACSNPDTRMIKPRVVVSTDIGGSDPDDFQSMVHYLIYANAFQTEGLISSPPKQGRKQHILEVIDAYERDYPQLKAHLDDYPEPDDLRAVTRQGATMPQQDSLPAGPSEGALWIIEKAMEKSDQPLYILVWGSITDVAQAVHAAPEIKGFIRVYSIGSWNTRLDSLSHAYLFDHHADMWWIDNNTTFRGMYMGGIQDDPWGNTSFVTRYVKDHGYLGRLYWEKKKDIKMGDTPSVLYLLNGDPANPEGPSWGGSFIKSGHGPQYWTDNPVDSLIVNNRPGARTVSRHRKAYLSDWAKRMEWLQ